MILKAFKEKSNRKYVNKLLTERKSTVNNNKMKNPDLEAFVTEPFDMLICFYKNSVLQLDQITAASHANFKVGISTTDERLYDLIIDVDLKDINIFKQELKKYLNILKKL